jgi:hypothetical protein
MQQHPHHGLIKNSINELIRNYLKIIHIIRQNPRQKKAKHINQEPKSIFLLTQNSDLKLI